jgi:hypothetical protein
MPRLPNQENPVEQFYSFAIPEPNSGCWLWLRGDWNGYAVFRQRQATHFAWSLKHGRPFPRGMFACHSCDTRICVNPDHIFVGTHHDNMADMFAKGRNPKVNVAGARNPGATMTEEQVRAIFADPRSSYAIARDYGVRPGTIWRIKTGKSWSHLKLTEGRKS